MPTLKLTLNILLDLAYFLVLARIFIGFFQSFVRGWEPKGATVVVLESIYTVTEPPLAAIRKVVKPVRLGGVGFDFSPVILIFGIIILQYVVAAFL